MRTLFSIVLMVLLAACANVTEINRNVSSEVRLDPSKSTYVAIPKDGRYGSTKYSESGDTAANLVMTGFLRHMAHIETGIKYQTYEEALSYAKKQKHTYLITLTILHWERRATAWSGKPTKASLRIVITDVGTGKQLDSVVIDARTSAVRMTSAQPQDVLPKPISQYVDSILVQ